jgi:hypothetical protein
MRFALCAMASRGNGDGVGQTFRTAITRRFQLSVPGWPMLCTRAP